MDRKEAIEIVQKNYPHVGTSGSEFETALRELVPELKESEDERIRKHLIEIVETYWGKTNDPGKAADLSYLERQKDERELSFIEGKVEGIRQTCQEIKDAMYLFEPKDLTPFEFTFRDYIDSAIRNCLSGEGYQQYIKEWAADLLNLEKQKEQKQTEWSEDERIRNMLIEQMEHWHECALENNVIQDIKDSADAISWLEKQKKQKPKESISQLTVQGKGIYKICPRCKERMVRDDSKVYTSMPPQYGYICPKCGTLEFDTVMYDSPEMEEQKPAQTVDEKEYIRTIKGIIADFVRDKQPEDVAFYQKIYDWLDGRHIEQKPVDDKAFEEWIDDWWKHNKVNNPDSYDKCDEIQFDERGFKNFCRGIRNMYQQQPAEWSEDYRGEDLRTRFAFYTYKDEDDALYLSNVFVEETSRNKGFGTKILAAAEKVAETIGAINIRLKVKQNSPANAWYRKHGYGYMAFEGDYDWLEKTLEYLKPIKSEWSEEDERHLNNAIEAVKYVYDISEGTNGFKCIKFLKSLRLQPKEDLNAIAQREYARGKQDGYWEGVKAERESCKTFHYESPNWPPKMPDLPTETTTNEGVSSIQPHWKPSERQIAALEWQIKNTYDGSWQRKESESLYNDLKSL